MKIRFSYFAVAAVLSLFVGCGEKSVALSENVVASVGRHVLTADELKVRENNIAALYRNRMGNAIDTNVLAQIRTRFRAGYALVWVEDRVLEDFAKEKGIQLDENVISNLQASAFRRFRRPTQKTYAKLISEAKLDLPLWNDQVLSEARRMAVGAYWLVNEPMPDPEGAVDAELEKMRLWNLRAAETNAVQWAKATNVWNQVRAGGDFVTIGKANTEVEEEIEDDCEWAIVDEKFLSDEPELFEAVKKMKVGEISAPVRGDNGICILRLDSLEDEGGYRLSRIFIRLSQEMHPAPRNEIRVALEARYESELFRRKLKELRDNAKPFMKQGL